MKSIISIFLLSCIFFVSCKPAPSSINQNSNNIDKSINQDSSISNVVNEKSTYVISERSKEKIEKHKARAEEIKEKQRLESNNNMPCEELIKKIEKNINILLKNPNDESAISYLIEVNNDPFHADCKKKKKYYNKFNQLIKKWEEAYPENEE